MLQDQQWLFAVTLVVMEPFGIYITHGGFLWMVFDHLDNRGRSGRRNFIDRMSQGFGGYVSPRLYQLW